MSARPLRVLAIDPGQSGGIAVVQWPKDLLHAVNTPLTDAKQVDGFALATIILAYEPDLVVIEAVSSRPRQAGQFGFGLNTGILHGVAMACRVPIKTVAPAKWKAAYGLKTLPGESYKDVKNKSRAMATQLFPQHAHLFARVKDDGVAEAVLMATFVANTQH